MEFLKRLTGSDGQTIEVKKALAITVQCEKCDYWGKMDGGEIEGGKAVFQCPVCKTLNYVAWGNIG